MVLSVQNIVDYLEENGYVVHYSISTEKANLSKCRWLYSDDFTYGVLYIEPEADCALGFVPLVTMVTYGNDILRVESSNPEMLFNLINDAFWFYTDWERRLLKCLLFQNSLSDLIRIGDEVFQAPMIIDGSEGQCYAITDNYPANIHPLWQKRLENDAESFKFIRQTEKIPRYKRLQYTTEPCFNPSVEWPWNTLHSNLFCNGRRAGFIVAYEYQHKMRPGDLHLMHVFARVVEQYFSRYPEKYCYTLYIEHFIFCVLFQNLNNWAKLQTILNYKKWQFHDRYCVCTLLPCNGKEVMRQEQIDELAGGLRRALPDSVCIVHKGRILLLINQSVSADGCLLPESLPDALCCGQSMDFNDLRQISRYFRQSEAVADLCRTSGRHLLRAHECIAQWMTAVLNTEPYPQTLVLDAIKAVAHYDLIHKSSFLATFRMLLLCNFNYSDTAQVLNIHRNTLLQRIHRIEQLMGLPLDAFIQQHDNAGLLVQCNLLLR